MTRVFQVPAYVKFFLAPRQKGTRILRSIANEIEQEKGQSQVSPIWEKSEGPAWEKGNWNNWRQSGQ